MQGSHYIHGQSALIALPTNRKFHFFVFKNLYKRRFHIYGAIIIGVQFIYRNREQTDMAEIR